MSIALLLMHHQHSSPSSLCEQQLPAKFVYQGLRVAVPNLSSRLVPDFTMPSASRGQCIK